YSMKRQLSLRHLARLYGRAEIEEEFGKAAGRRACICSGDQHHFRVCYGRKSVLRFKHAMFGQDCDLGQNADAETNRDRGLDAGEIVTCICNMPGAPCRFDGVDHAIAIEAALVGHHERQWIAVIVDRMLLARDPMQTLGPRRDSASLAGFALEQCEIEL